MKRISLGLLLGLLLAACSSFYNSANKTIYATSLMADASMQAYAGIWKARTNQAGFIPDPATKSAKLASLNFERSNVEAISFDVGASLAVANKALLSYQQNLGTNTTTQAMVEALLTTAVQRAGSLAALVELLRTNAP